MRNVLTVFILIVLIGCTPNNPEFEKEVLPESLSVDQTIIKENDTETNIVETDSLLATEKITVNQDYEGMIKDLEEKIDYLESEIIILSKKNTPDWTDEKPGMITENANSEKIIEWIDSLWFVEIKDNYVYYIEEPNSSDYFYPHEEETIIKSKLIRKNLDDEEITTLYSGYDITSFIVSNDHEYIAVIHNNWADDFTSYGEIVDAKGDIIFSFDMNDLVGDSNKWIAESMFSFYQFSEQNRYLFGVIGGGFSVDGYFVIDMSDYTVEIIIINNGTSRWNELMNRMFVTENNQVIYENYEYGFGMQLPASWVYYEIVEADWEGQMVGDRDQETGPKFLIKHPSSTDSEKRQDIPIMVFTKEQWNLLLDDKMGIGAAPMPPTELGRSDEYVYAIPPRYNYAYPEGFEEVEEILNSDSFYILD